MKKLLLMILSCSLIASSLFCQGTPTNKTKKKKKVPKAENPVQESDEFKAIELNTFTVFNVAVDVLYCGTEKKEFLSKKIQQSFDRANAAFSGAAVRFQIDGNIHFNCDPQFSIFDKSAKTEEVLYQKYCLSKGEKRIHLFVVDNIINPFDAQDGELGYTYMPYYHRVFCREFIILSLDGIVRDGTLAHEMGHFFGLHHTHGDENTFEKELVSGANCYSAGDSICDTPADPMLSKKVAYAGADCSCQYVGGDLDPNYEAYHPLTDNIMSYTLDKCRTKFTAGQLNKIGYQVRWHKQTFKHSIDKRLNPTWNTDLTTPSLIAAKEDYLLSKRGRNVLLFVYENDNTLCQSLYSELSQPYMQEILHDYDYKVVFFDVAQDREMIDFFGNDAIYRKADTQLQRWLNKEVVHFPGIITIQFDPDREKRTLQVLVFGYMNPRMLKRALISCGRPLAQRNDIELNSIQPKTQRK